MTTAVTVCVSVFNAAAFLAETLDSIAAQSFHDIKVLISLDRSDDDSESVCRRYLHDRRFELIVQRERLGWVGNVNALIERVGTPYLCITRSAMGPPCATCRASLPTRMRAACETRLREMCCPTLQTAHRRLHGESEEGSETSWRP